MCLLCRCVNSCCGKLLKTPKCTDKMNDMMCFDKTESSKFEEIADFMEYVSHVNDGYLLPKYPVIQKRASSFFFNAIEKSKPDLLGMALTAGLTEREFFTIQINLSYNANNGFDVYMYTVVEIVDAAFKKQKAETCFIMFLSKVLGQMANFQLLCHGMWEDFSREKEKILQSKRKTHVFDKAEQTKKWVEMNNDLVEFMPLEKSWPVPSPSEKDKNCKMVPLESKTWAYDPARHSPNPEQIELTN